MGDISVEPSMEDILSSIKRIIAEEGETPPTRPRKPARLPAATVDVDETVDADDDDEVLELNDPMPPPIPAAPRRDHAAAVPTAPVAAEEPAAEPIVSHAAAAATRGSLDALTRMMVKPEPASDGTLEGLVRDMLRPMLREWLDAKLPDMVEAMVAREIAKITGQPG